MLQQRLESARAAAQREDRFELFDADGTIVELPWDGDHLDLGAPVQLEGKGPPERRVEGKVLDAKGSPVLVCVRLHGQWGYGARSFTGPDGSFSFGFDFPGPATLFPCAEVDGPDFVETPLPEAKGTTRVVLRASGSSR